MIFTVDGHEVFAATGGQPFDGEKPNIVFIHGAALDRTVWNLQTRYFAWHGRSVLALDLPGHGRSGGPPLASIPDIADWVIRLLDAAGLERAALVGHSMGALVVLDAAGRHADRVNALALLGPGYPMRVTDVLLETSRAGDPVAFDLMNAWGFGGPAQLGRHRMPGLWMMRGGLRIWQRGAPGLLHCDLMACHEYETGFEAAQGVACPTLLVMGSDDMMAPLEKGRALAEHLADSREVVLPDCGHIMIEEYPDESLDALRTLV